MKLLFTLNKRLYHDKWYDFWTIDQNPYQIIAYLIV